EEATQRIVSLHQRRLDLIENALQALNLQYPSYAQWLQESYLGRVARDARTHPLSRVSGWHCGCITCSAFRAGWRASLASALPT
ncbi:hypothetical protein CTI14_40775, partial [Methylobacterium radiotolerans]